MLLDECYLLLRRFLLFLWTLRSMLIIAPIQIAFEIRILVPLLFKQHAQEAEHAESEHIQAEIIVVSGQAHKVFDAGAAQIGIPQS